MAPCFGVFSRKGRKRGRRTGIGVETGRETSESFFDVEYSVDMTLDIFSRALLFIRSTQLVVFHPRVELNQYSNLCFRK
jgi:hypothetical protein